MKTLSLKIGISNLWVMILIRNDFGFGEPEKTAFIWNKK